MPSWARHLQDTSSSIDAAHKSNRIANQPLGSRKKPIATPIW